MRLAHKVADRVVFLHEAKVVFYGTPDEMIRSPQEIVREFIELDSPSIDQFRHRPEAGTVPSLGL
jgi:ABC-type transporter Mla maintaining outer membrane lipid asymmetry ATPase subunit MlaF